MSSRHASLSHHLYTEKRDSFLRRMCWEVGCSFCVDTNRFKCLPFLLSSSFHPLLAIFHCLPMNSISFLPSFLVAKHLFPHLPSLLLLLRRRDSFSCLSLKLNNISLFLVLSSWRLSSYQSWELLLLSCRFPSSFISWLEITNIVRDLDWEGRFLRRMRSKKSCWWRRMGEEVKM